MNFLLVNDDGFTSEGLKAMAEALVPFGDIYVCAPDEQQSGMSHSITLMDTIWVKEEEFPLAKKAWMVHGTPADCTKIGVQMLTGLNISIDVIFSGVNKGSNLGKDTLYSGTVGAAMEGVLLGYRAIAVSVNGHEATHFRTPCEIAIKVLPKVLEMEPGIVININSPDLPREEIKGVRVATLGPSYFVDGFVLQEGCEYRLEGSIPDYKHLGEKIDAGANALGYVTITPLQPDFTEKALLKEMEAWDLSL